MSEQPQIILNRLIKLNNLMLEEATRMGRPHLKPQLETQKALMDMLEPYLEL